MKPFTSSNNRIFTEGSKCVCVLIQAETIRMFLRLLDVATVLSSQRSYNARYPVQINCKPNLWMDRCTNVHTPDLRRNAN